MEKTVIREDLIKGRIMDEYRKHPDLDWAAIAARKLYTQWLEYFESEATLKSLEDNKALREQLNALPDNNTLDLMKRVNDAEHRADNFSNIMHEYMHMVEEVIGFCGPRDRALEALLKMKSDNKALSDMCDKLVEGFKSVLNHCNSDYVSHSPFKYLSHKYLTEYNKIKGGKDDK